MESFDVSTEVSHELFKIKLKTFIPDIVLLDVFIRQLDGREICRELKGDTESSHLPVLLMSADPRALKNYQECFADGAIDKPFDLPELLRQIKFLTHSRIVNFDMRSVLLPSQPGLGQISV